MRTTVDIDEDVLKAARDLAKKEGSTLGRVLSKLARQSLPNDVSSRWTMRNGVPLFTANKDSGEVIDLELINRLRDEDPYY